MCWSALLGILSASRRHPAALWSLWTTPFLPAVIKLLAETVIDTAFIDSGKPWQNGSDESFNGRLRDECLNPEWFRFRAEANVVIETWRQGYNRE